MTLSGDINKTPGLRLDADIYVTNSGLISDNQIHKDYQIKGVSRVIDGTIDRVIHLIGYPNTDIENLITAGIIRSTNQIKSQLKQLPPRAPGSYLLQKDERLYGVIVDSNGEARIAGRVNCVIPSQQSNGYCNTVMIEKDGDWKTCSSKDFDLRVMIATGAVFGIVSNDGFVFIQTKISPNQQLSQLVLIQQKGYFVICDTNVDWIRLKVGLHIGKIESRVTRLEPFECIVSRSGGCVRNGDRFELFGSGNAIINFNAFQDMMVYMKTVQFNQIKKEDDRENNVEVVAKQYETNRVTQNITKTVDSTLERSSPNYDYICEAYEEFNIIDTEQGHN